MQIDILGLVHAMILRCADLHVYFAILFRKLVIEQWLTHHESNKYHDSIREPQDIQVLVPR